MAHHTRRPTKRQPIARTSQERELTTPLEIALHRAAKLIEPERLELIGPVFAAFEVFRLGLGHIDAWAQLADTMNIARELAERQIASDHKGTFQAAQEALTAVYERAEAKGCWTLRGPEIATLDLALFVFKVQLDNCSRGELQEAVTRVVNRIEQARAGNAAPGVRVVDPWAAAASRQQGAALMGAAA